MKRTSPIKVNMKRTSRSVSSKYDSQSGMRVSALKIAACLGRKALSAKVQRGDGLDIALDQRPTG